MNRECFRLLGLSMLLAASSAGTIAAQTTPLPSTVQTSRSTPPSAGSRAWEQYFYDIADYGDNSIVLDEDAWEMLCEMEDNPLNINTATREDLEQLPFLTARQIEDIMEYLYRYGPMRSLAELQLITSLDYPRRRLLECFVTAGDTAPPQRPSLKDILATGRSQLLVTCKQPLYRRKGDRNGYLGYASRHSFQYTFDAGDYLKAGLAGAQDAGEPFFSSPNTMGYDHYAFYVQLQKLGRLENLIAGRFKVQFGMGLVANTGFSLGKASSLEQSGRTTNAVRPSLSRSAASYMQGLAATVRLTRDLRLHTFVSYRPIDATLNADGTIRTVVTTGYHRTPAEVAKKNNSHQFTGGLNATFSRAGWHAGLTAVYTRYDRALAPQTSTLYRRYYPAGNNFFNAGVHYGYTGHSFSAAGETALDQRGALATVNSATITLPFNLSLMTLYRFYSQRYNGLYANSFSDGGHVKNEHGIFLGITWTPVKDLSINLYGDYAHSPWARYRISKASDAFDTQFRATWTRKRLTLNGRYRLRTTYRDNQDKKSMTRRMAHTARLAARVDWGRGWGTTTQADFALTDYKTTDRGYMVSQAVDGGWRWLRVSGSFNYFRTDSYESRLYSYERGLLHSFAFPAMYGHGIRYALMLRADVMKKLMFIVKTGVTDYFDRAKISSGLQQIDGSSQADLELQARWSF